MGGAYELWKLATKAVEVETILSNYLLNIYLLAYLYLISQLLPASSFVH